MANTAYSSAAPGSQYRSKFDRVVVQLGVATDPARNLGMVFAPPRSVVIAANDVRTASSMCSRYLAYAGRRLCRSATGDRQLQCKIKILRSIKGMEDEQVRCASFVGTAELL